MSFLRTLWNYRIYTGCRACVLGFRSTYRFYQLKPVLRSSSNNRSQWSQFIGTPLIAFSIPFFKKKTPEEEMKEAWALGLDGVYNGDLKSADSYFHVVLRILAEQHQRGEITEREYQGKRARVTSELANVSLIKRDWESAEILLKATMRDCLTCGLDQQGPEMVEMSLKIAQIMSMTGRKAAAEKGFRFCVESQQDSLKSLPAEEDPNEESDDRKNHRALLGICASAYSKFLHIEGRYPEALEMNNLALAEARKLYDDVNPNIVTLMGDSAVLHAEMSQHKEAEKILRDAIEIAEYRPDLLLTMLPNLYINLASVYLRCSRLKDAEEMAKIAQRLLRDIPASNSTETSAEQANIVLDKVKKALASNLEKNSK